jgi:hypothetical protein
MATRFDGDIIDGMNSSSGFVEQLPNLAFDSRTKGGEAGLSVRESEFQL